MSPQPSSQVPGWFLKLKERYLADRRWLDARPTQAIKAKHRLVLEKLMRTEARLNELESVLSWETSCVGCSHLIDAIYNEHVRRSQAENAIATVRDVHVPCRDEMCEETDAHRRYRGVATFCSVEHERFPCTTILAMVEASGTTFSGPGGNAEDCPSCAFRHDLVYPFLCACQIPAANDEADE